jgi:hypothetical protein
MEGSHEMEFSESANIQGSREILFSLGRFLISVYLGFEWVTLNHFPFLEGRAGHNKHLFYQRNKKEERNISKSRIVGIMALIIFAMGILLVGDALAGERGKVANREMWFRTTVQTLKAPDMEGHTIHLWEAKGIVFTEKWGACQGYVPATNDFIAPEGEMRAQGYVQYTFPDGSTTIQKWESKSKELNGTWTYLKGTGKFEGIQGGGTYKSYNMGPGQ